MSTHPYPPKTYLHTQTHAQNIPPLTPTHIKNVHLPLPTQNIPPPTPTHHYPPIKNIQPTRPTKYIHPHTLTQSKYTSTHTAHSNKRCSTTTIHPKHTSTYPHLPKIYLHQPSPTHKKCPPNQTRPKYTFV